MAGQAPEGSQFNARQYDYKMVPGFEKLSAIQERGIVPFCKGLDVIQQAQPGPGKMVSFCSCIFHHLDYELLECQAPALAQELEKVKHALGDYLGVKVHACFGGTSVREDQKVHVGVSTPGLVFDMLCRQYLRANNIQMLVLDEVDELLSRDFKDQMAVDWSTLPLDILGDIAIKLESCDDFIYFSAVCRSWNRSSSSVKNLWMATPVPWLLLAENTERDPNCPRNILKLNNNKRYSLNLPEMYGARCWGSPYGWVAVAKRDLSIQLFNPITKANICFPSLQTIPCLPVDYPDDRWFDYYEWILVIFLQKLIVLKVSEGGGHHEFVIVLLSQFMKGPIFAKHGDQLWTTILIKEPKVNVSDVVAMDDLVFALYDNEGAIAYWSATEFGLGVVKPMVYSTGSPRICKLLRCKANSAYLVQSGSDLLMVIRINLGGENVDDSDDDDYFETTYGTVDFKLFKINPNDKKLENVEDLGDVALFVGQNSSMLVSSAHGKGLQSGCIYFTDDYSELWFFPNKRTMLAGHDMGVFDLGTNRVERFYEGNDTRSLFCSPTWFVPHF